MNMVCHDGKRSELIVTEFNSMEERVDHQTCNGVLAQKHGSVACKVQVTIHPNERLSSGRLRGRRIATLGKTAMQMPGHEQPTAFRIKVRQAAVRIHFTEVVA